MVVANKSDVLRLDELAPEDRESLNSIQENDIPLLSMSTLTEEGVSEVKQQV